MEKEFVNYEIALELKNLGFNEPCIGFWWNNKDFTEPEFLLEYCEHVMDGNLKRPTFSHAFRWFREKYDLHGITFKNRKNRFYNEGIETHSYTIMGNYNNILYNTLSNEYKLSFEEAELECLKKLIEIVKEQK